MPWNIVWTLAGLVSPEAMRLLPLAWPLLATCALTFVAALPLMALDRSLLPWGIVGAAAPLALVLLLPAVLAVVQWILRM